MSFSFKKQLGRMFEGWCYRAFGEHISTRVKDSPSLKQYHVHISHDLYEHYRKDGFRFSAEGTTKKSIALDMEVHIESCNNFDWEIDEFGCFKVEPTTQYLQSSHQKVLEGEFSFLPVLPNHKLPDSDMVYQFDYIVDNIVNKDNILLISELERRALVREILNKAQVQRYFFIENLGNQAAMKTVQKLINKKIMNKNRLSEIAKIGKGDKKVRQMACFSENYLYYSNLLPHHDIYPISHYPFEASAKQCADFGQLSIEMIIVRYGDMMDANQFSQAELLLQYLATKSEYEKQYKILTQNWGKICGDSKLFIRQNY